MKLYQRNPNEEWLTRLLKETYLRPEPSTRYIILSGVDGVNTPSSIEILTSALEDTTKVVSGKGPSYVDYSDFLRKRANSLFQKHPLKASAKPRSCVKALFTF